MPKVLIVIVLWCLVSSVNAQEKKEFVVFLTRSGGSASTITVMHNSHVLVLGKAAHKPQELLTKHIESAKKR